MAEKADDSWFTSKSEDASSDKSRDSGSSNYETVETDTKYRRRDIEPEYEHESPELNPDGSLKTTDNEIEDSRKQKNKNDGSSPFARMVFVLLLLTAIFTTIYFLIL